MFSLESIIQTSPYALDKERKGSLYNEALHGLTEHHYQNCEPYRKLLNTLGYSPNKERGIAEMPFLPVRLFKEYDLRSVASDDTVKTMTSSGTSGQSVSKIYLDKTNAANQTKVLTKIVANYLGEKRMPMLVIDSPAVLKNRTMFSARGAGILGFSMFGNKVVYALDEEMRLDIAAVEAFYEQYKDQDVLLFGFTYMVWEYFYKALVRAEKQLLFANGTLIHGGGWKKLADEAVSNEAFKESLEKVCALKQVVYYYGMVEQTGSIFMECSEGHLHASIFSDVLVRRKDLSLCDFQERGLIEVISLLPSSYPGHILLSEDEGEILGEDDCPCGRLGKYFKVYGRIAEAEIRGCSDTHERQ